MTAAYRRDVWDRASHQIAATMNCQFGRKKAVRPKDINPFLASAKESNEPDIEGDITCLSIFLPPGQRKKVVEANRKRKREQQQ